MAEPIAELRHVVKTYRLRQAAEGGPAEIKAVNDVSLAIQRGQAIALVGESGSGKTTIGRMLAHLERPTSGEIRIQGTDTARMSQTAFRPLRSVVQLIFQDPYSSLDPRRTIGQTLVEPLDAQGIGDRSTRRRRVSEVLELVEMPAADGLLGKYPHALSGGQRQRIAIARALVVNPALIVADEPVSMLDVSIRAGVLATFERLNAELGLALLFITHDLAVARYIGRVVVVMYRGKVVEYGSSEQVIRTPSHHYTALLIDSAPTLSRTALRADSGAAGASPTVSARGCPFAPRCPAAQPICHEEEPPLIERAPGHYSACHFPISQKAM